MDKKIIKRLLSEIGNAKDIKRVRNIVNDFADENVVELELTEDED